MMVHIIMRADVADYEKWRPVFDDLEDLRRSKGSTGANHVYRDVENPNTITLILGWDTAENARNFLGSPQLREAMQKAGVAGAPAVSTVITED
jgi:quinol monooxygenase YgiN